MSSFAFSIRTKIVVLLLAALSTSLMSYMYLGTSLIIEDKASYIYDYTLSQVRTATDLLQSRIHQVQALAIALGNRVDPLQPRSNRASLENIFLERAGTFHIKELLILRPADRTRFVTEMKIPENAPWLARVLESQGWSPVSFEKKSILVGTGEFGHIPVAFSMTDAAGRPIVIIVSIDIDADVFENRGSHIQMELVDPSGTLLAASADFKKDAGSGEIKRLNQELSEQRFPSGALDWVVGGKSYIVAHQRLAESDIFAVGLVSQEETLRTAQVLIYRSVVLGITVLLFAMGATILLARGLTQRLQALWRATLSIGQGNFSLKLDPGKNRDEVSDLATSFNVMTGRIQELLRETATKARLEKEIEMAQALQDAFFPEKSSGLGGFRLAGKMRSATECAGDWWQHSAFGRYMLVAVGDVTGHGVSAALVTAAIHGAYSLLIRELSEENLAGNEAATLERLITRLNRVICDTAHGTSQMTLVLSLIDTRDFKMSVVNAAHHAPLVCHRSPSPCRSRSDLINRVVSMADGSVPPLGSQPEINAKCLEFALEPGDTLLWYTDGLLECESPKGEQLRKTDLLVKLVSLADQEGADAELICLNLLTWFNDFLGQNGPGPADDTTIIVGVVAQSPDTLVVGSRPPLLNKDC